MIRELIALSRRRLVPARFDHGKNTVLGGGGLRGFGHTVVVDRADDRQRDEHQ
jgi:hypothetical protein